MQQQSSVELDVGIEPAIGPVLPQQAKRGLFYRLGESIKLLIAPMCVKAPGRFSQHVGSRITNFVDAMAESHEPLAAIELGAKNGFGALRHANLEDHVECGTRCAAVERTLQGADRACDCGNDVRLGGNDHSRGECG